MEKRVVITGLGVVSSIGTGKEAFWDALISGRSGISKVSAFDTSEFPTHYAGEIRGFDPLSFVDEKKVSGMGRASLFAVAASKLASKDAKFGAYGFDPELTGVCFGTTMGEPQIVEELNESWIKNGIDSIDPALIPLYPCNVLSANVAAELNARGPNFVIPNACAAANYAIGYAYDLIRMGEADVMFAGGADCFSKIVYIGFNRMLAVAPEKCQPFDKDRKGMMVGEGAAVLVLEEMQKALKRGADIYAEILGYGISCDAHHMTAPNSEGIKEAIQKAIKDSRIRPEDVDYFNAHGTATPANDREECAAINKVFGNGKGRPKVSSIKSMLGHTMGAASAIEALSCCLTIRDGIIPPTINYQTPDPECDIDCVANTACRSNVNVVLNSNSAFGGNNACLVLKRFEG